MNVFKVYKDVRKVGQNYGMPMCFIDCGLGMNYKIEEVVGKLGKEGLKKGDWVLIRNGMSEKGVGLLVEGLKFIGLKVEVEAVSSDRTPGWFLKVDTWTVFYNGSKIFNFGALRPRQDMVISKGDGLEGMVEQIKGLSQVDKGVILDGQIDFNLLFNNKVRVYKDVD